MGSPRHQTHTHRLRRATRPRPAPVSDESSSSMPMYRIETLSAGTVSSIWLRLTRASPLEEAFFTSVSAATRPPAGSAAAPPAATASSVPTAPWPPPAVPLPDWRGYLAVHRGDALSALEDLAATCPQYALLSGHDGTHPWHRTLVMARPDGRLTLASATTTGIGFPGRLWAPPRRRNGRPASGDAALKAQRRHNIRGHRLPGYLWLTAYRI